jgi:uncharacterized protein
MTLHSSFSEENPFNYLKARDIFLCYFLVFIGSAILLFFGVFFGIILNYIPGYNYRNFPLEPIIPPLIIQVNLGLTAILILRKLKLVQIHPQAILGKFTRYFKWWKFIGIVLARYTFSFGSFLVLHHLLSFIFPSWIESRLSNDILSHASQSFSPFFYYLLLVTEGLVESVVGVFLLQGVLLHIWSAKRGIKSALIMLSIVYLVIYNINCIGGISLCLMLAIMYIKTKTLIIPIVADVINKIVNPLLFTTLFGENPLESLHSLFGIGIFCLAISTPLLIWLVYKNRIRPNEQTPYFANLQQLRSNE